MAGPLPPAIGGMTTVIDDLSRSTLRETVTLELFNTAKTTPSGRSLMQAVRARLVLWRAWWRAMRADGRPVAHIHTCSGLSFFLDGALVLMARACGAPVVLHVHGGRFDVFLDGLDALRSWLARAIVRQASRVVVLSEVWRQRLAPRLPGSQLAVVENGVPVPLRQPEHQESGETIVLFLGALCRAKGVEDLIRAAARLPERVRVVLVGPETEPGFLQGVRSLIGELALERRVQIAGPAHGKERALWLSRATIFVLPSHIEAQPISILEAMAAGIPVVATAVGAVPSVVKSGATGIVVEAGDVDALADAMNHLLGDAAIRDQFARQAFEECARRFSIDRTAAQLFAIYSEVSKAAEPVVSLPARRRPLPAAPSSINQKRIDP